MSRDVTGYCAFHAFAGTEAERETCEDCHAMQKMGERMFQPPATPQEPDVRGDIGHQNAEIQRLGNAVRDGSATSEMAYAWLTHPYVCTSDMVKAAARIMASTPSPEGQTWQPIETAPKDGRRVLVMWEYWSSEPFVAYFKHGRWNGEVALSECSDDGPTHWMPLPSPPTPEGTQP